MNDLETYDPSLAQKLERRAIAKKERVASYELWVWRGGAVQVDVCNTKEEALSIWREAKLNKWQKWELQQDRKIIKKGVF